MRLALVVLFGLVAGFALPTYSADRPQDPFGAAVQTTELKGGPLAREWRDLRDRLYHDDLRIAACVEFSKAACPPVAKLFDVVEEARHQVGKALLAHLNRTINLMIR